MRWISHRSTAPGRPSSLSPAADARTSTSRALSRGCSGEPLQVQSSQIGYSHSTLSPILWAVPWPSLGLTIAPKRIRDARERHWSVPRAATLRAAYGLANRSERQPQLARRSCSLGSPRWAWRVTRLVPSSAECFGVRTRSDELSRPPCTEANRGLDRFHLSGVGLLEPLTELADEGRLLELRHVVQEQLLHPDLRHGRASAPTSALVVDQV